MSTSEKTWAFDIHVELSLDEMEAIVQFDGTSGIVTQDKIEKILASYVTDRLDEVIAARKAKREMPRRSAEIQIETKRVHDDDLCPYDWNEPHVCNHTKEIEVVVNWERSNG